MPAIAAYLASTLVVAGGSFGAGGDARHASWRAEISSGDSSTLMVRSTRLMSIMSPFCTIASGPPCAASGQRWPIMIPWLAPEKRPSVTSATFVPRPRPTRAPPGESISGIPGAPLGPSWRTTSTSPSFTSPLWIAAYASRSSS